MASIADRQNGTDRQIGADPGTAFTRIAHPAPVAAAVRDAALADPGFGKLFSDHMVSIDWSETQGWHNSTIVT